VSLDQLTALSIVRVWSGRPRYPRRAEGEADMANTLIECCVSEAHARAVVAEFQDVFPTPGEVRNQAANLREQFEPKKSVCPECEGSGFVSRTIRGQDYATPCACRRRNFVKPAQPAIEFPGTKLKLVDARGKKTQQRSLLRKHRALGGTSGEQRGETE
jgi:hypothetical protein